MAAAMAAAATPASFMGWILPLSSLRPFIVTQSSSSGEPPVRVHVTVFNNRRAQFLSGRLFRLE
jgi:hypothetical protein